VSVAWEPADPRPGMSRLSFGQHRASVFAKALVDAKKQGEPVVPFLKSAFVAANIDPLTPFRNLTSPTDDQEETCRTHPRASGAAVFVPAPAPFSVPACRRPGNWRWVSSWPCGTDSPVGTGPDLKGQRRVHDLPHPS